MISGYFITGSDTDVGKTWISCQLIDQLNACHASVKVRKPIESGCEHSPEGQLLPADGHRLFLANNSRESLDIITPYCFQAALAPDRAARLENQSITLEQLTQAVRNQLENNDKVLVEGAGGFYSPIAEATLNSDLALALNLDIIIVIPDRLGAINQALLTIHAVESLQLKIHAVILNQVEPKQPKSMDNFDDIQSRIKYPIYLCPYNGFLEHNIFCGQAIKNKPAL
ncbi:MAG: dethiobiotin synthase [Gammaproteobacteria bacterium]|nr:dethiobiotin synthase [Gammaproteobacteria bacterium]